MKTQKENFYNLVRKIKDNGVSEPKRHGEYVRLKMFDGYLLLLDTWSSAITVFKDDKQFEYLGMDFGGFSCRNITMVKFWAAHIP